MASRNNQTADVLPSWNDGPARAAILDFVERTTREGSADYVAPVERVAVFDNDGTLWCEKPMPIELGFILRRFAEMADADKELRDRQPWKAAHEQDYAWLGGAVAKHYAGDDSDVKLLFGGLLQAFAGMSVEEYAAGAHAFLTGGAHPTLGRGFTECAYAPMLELLRHLEAKGFTSFIISGGDCDFMRTVTQQIYGIPSERVVGSTAGLGYEPDEHGGSVVYTAEMDFFDDGPIKPARIWSRIGRRPVVAAGNSNGDIEMLRYAGGRARTALRLLVLHDDPEREFDYTAGSEKALEAAHAEDWTVVSVKNDWANVFIDPVS
jgi:phosphoserine phosphatase